ncbi:IS4 family transposase, partial [Paraburkholderia aspalathi]|uniref:IS4 family transposase n=1 Tax=Paraburkholderia aspalathi TaxID=1324617 RepID=UPI00190A8FDE
MLRLHSSELRTYLDGPKHFSRRRKLDFVTLICWFMAGQRAAVQTGLDHFFAVVRNQADLVRQVTAQALSRARKHLPVAVFDDLSQCLLELVGQHVGIPFWHGLRVVATDGSSVRVTIRDAMRRIRYAQVFGLYLPGVEMMLHATLYSCDTGERQMLFEHLARLHHDDLLVMDRGYPASWLMAAMISRQLNFCVRVDATGSAAVKAFIRGQAIEAIVEMPAPSAQDALDYEIAREPFRVRLIRIITPDGLIRVLATNLLDPHAWPATDFGALYHQRWRIEEAF